MDSAPVELALDGIRFAWWQRLSIRESVDDLCSAVQLAVTLPGNGDGLGITANTVARLQIESSVLTTVRPDSLRRTVAKDSHDIHLEARSLGRELVDCQYSKTMNGLKLSELVKRLCDVFKVPVTIDAETAVVPNFSMQCEVPANALINAVRAANLLLYPLPDGGLILTSPTNALPVSILQLGVNIKRYAVVDEFKLRFSDYTIKGYAYDQNSALKGAAKDTGLDFFRPMHVIADKHGQGLGACQRRAELERNRRLARAHRIEIEVSGWRYVDEKGLWQPWAINTQVRVIIPSEGIDDVFLIGERTFNLDDQGGHVTHLQVMHRNAFLGEEKKKAKRGAGVKGVRK
jgi:prophage tail gpP-like protein